ncbi:MAG: hypothetical protein KBH99_02285 [Syntrophobacteraceae bacterium]|nr:hypothetical protein [Syntrophobacteraceae bacterium]
MNRSRIKYLASAMAFLAVLAFVVPSYAARSHNAGGRHSVSSHRPTNSPRAYNRGPTNRGYRNQWGANRYQGYRNQWRADRSRGYRGGYGYNRGRGDGRYSHRYAGHGYRDGRHWNGRHGGHYRDGYRHGRYWSRHHHRHHWDHGDRYYFGFIGWPYWGGYWGGWPYYSYYDYWPSYYCSYPFPYFFLPGFSFMFCL